MPNEDIKVTPPVGDDDNDSGANANGEAGNNGDGDQADVVDWKQKYEEEQGRRERAESKLEKLKTKPAESPAPSKSSELDYGQKAFLIANGVKEAEEIALVQKVMGDTGKSLEDVLGSKYFQAELKEIRDAKAVNDAIPDGSKRSNQSASNTVEYWIAKGELPPADQRELRQQVVNARMKSETNKNQFTDNPVVR